MRPDVISKEDLSLAQENDRFGRDNRILKEESAKKGRGILCKPKSVRVKFVEERRSAFSIELMCRVMECQSVRTTGVPQLTCQP